MSGAGWSIRTGTWTLNGSSLGALEARLLAALRQYGEARIYYGEQLVVAIYSHHRLAEFFDLLSQARAFAARVDGGRG